MSDHARNHRAYMAAQLAASSEASGQMSHLSHYELLLFKFKQALDRLKGIESHHRKAQLKRERLPVYQPWLAGVLASDAGAKGADAGQASGRERH